MRRNFWPFPLAVFLSIFLGVGFCAAESRAAEPVSASQRLDQFAGACTEPRIVGTAAQLAVAWLVNDGLEPGVYLRRRENWVWGPPTRVAGSEALGLRDLQVGLASDGCVSMAWTQQGTGGRALILARQPKPIEPHDLHSIAVAADFPALAVQPDGSAYLAWQQGAGLRQEIAALKVDARDATQSLGVLSGAEAGMNPQILPGFPLQVAWYAVKNLGTELRVSLQVNGRWELRTPAFSAKVFPLDRSLLLRGDSTAIVGAWPLGGDGETRGLGVGLVRQFSGPMPFATIRTSTDTILRPAGDLVQPSLGGDEARRTLVYQAFLEGSQRVCITSVLEPSRRRLLIVSPGTQRFAAMPDHATAGDWSGVVWIDRARDGGDGGVYISEISWME